MLACGGIHSDSVWGGGWSEGECGVLEGHGELGGREGMVVAAAFGSLAWKVMIM